MPDDDQGPVTHEDSAAQRGYVYIAEKIRARLEQIAKNGVGSYRPEEVKWFTDACQTAYWFELNARDFDRKDAHPDCYH